MKLLNQSGSSNFCSELRKNALLISQSHFSNFALHVISEAIALQSYNYLKFKMPNQKQSRSQSPRSSVRRIVGLWENAENQPLTGCLIISLIHFLLVEIRAILIIQKAKCKLVYLTRLFIAH